ncbi:MAG: prepilin-type N-terminal cleavage/methylation domain-containing protein [Synergistaceae bacterium]|nr:prepilin-type N-terminal cleavage/methylation domain-containing protein [Synergistaceae bacterium]
MRPGMGRRGETLVELLLSLLLLALVLASAFRFLADELLLLEKLRRLDDLRWELQRRVSRGLPPDP